MNHLKIMLIELYEFQKSALSFHLDLEFSFVYPQDLLKMICIFFRGTEDYLNCKGRVDIINSTLGKALGGSAGDHALMLFLPGAYVV